MHWRTKPKITLNSQRRTISIFGKHLLRHSLSWVLKYPTILSLAGIFLFTSVIRPAWLTTKITPWKYTLRTLTHLPVTNLHFHSKLLPSRYPTSPQIRTIFLRRGRVAVENKHWKIEQVSNLLIPKLATSFCTTLQFLSTSDMDKINQNSFLFSPISPTLLVNYLLPL